MILEAFVQKKINHNTYQCIVAIGKNKTREQLFTFYPLKKKNEKSFSMENLLNQAIYIWKDKKAEKETMYIGKIIFLDGKKIHVIHQAIEEIYKRIE